MNNIFNMLLPKNKKDVYFWFLFALAMLPIIYICCFGALDYMSLNIVLFSSILGYFLYRLIGSLVLKKKITFKINLTFILLSTLFLLIFVSAIFSQNPKATWLGVVDGEHKDVSVFQYLFYYLIAVCAMNIDKNNLKHLFYSFLTVISIMMIIQFCKQDYSFGFVNKNHTGYYLSITVCLAIGLILHSKNIYEILILSIILLMHFVSLVLNNSLGPIIGLIAYFVFAFIYYLIHNKKIFTRLFFVILACVCVFSFFDFVPKVKNIKDEETPIATQLVDVGLVALNKINIISDARFRESMLKRGGMTPGADGYDRFDMWEKSLDNMKEYPIFGVGVGAWKSYNSEFTARAPHNEFLELGACAGIPALLVYLTLLLTLFIMFRKKYKSQSFSSFIVFGAILSYLVQSVFGNILPFTAPLFYVMIGLAIKFISQKENLIENKQENDENLTTEKETV